uniref:Uncharacterized protein n=1 Tax=Parascaris equorum TaxID=6256 RepID=A0A914RSM6_PAREQ
MEELWQVTDSLEQRSSITRPRCFNTLRRITPNRRSICSLSTNGGYCMSFSFPNPGENSITVHGKCCRMVDTEWKSKLFLQGNEDGFRNENYRITNNMSNQQSVSQSINQLNSQHQLANARQKICTLGKRAKFGCPDFEKNLNRLFL